MPRKLVLEFTKMHGAGNDFVVIDNRFYHFTGEELAALARRWCPRRTGIGADGLLAFARPDDPAHDYRMHYRNADGSPAAMCGNGARCLARFARQAGLDKERLMFESDAGVYRAHVPASPEAPVRLYVPPPRDFVPDRPLLDGTADEALPYIWTGTEHSVRFVPSVEEASVEAEGRAVRHDAAFAPTGANVNFVEVIAEEPARLRVRTYEKGVEAETPACGTGALAAAVVARLTGRLHADRIAIEMPGGLLHAGFTLRDQQVTDLYLEGPAETSFRGTVEVG